MINRPKAAAILLITLLSLLSLIPSVCLAAVQPLDKPINLTIRIEISDPKLFWSYPYIAKDVDKARIPAAVQVEWGAFGGTNMTKSNVVTPGKNSGRLVITTERNALIDLQVSVVDANKVVLGTTGLQVRNNGQEEFFIISPPDFTAPTINHGNTDVTPGTR